MSGIEKECGICTWPHIFLFQVYTQYIIIDKTNLKEFLSQTHQVDEEWFM